MRVIPEPYLTRAHHWLILHGRYVCVARKPRCDACLVARSLPIARAVPGRPYDRGALVACRWGGPYSRGRRTFNRIPPPMTAHYDVAAIGNAIVDVIAPADDAFLADEGLAKGAMSLIDEARAQTLYGRWPPGWRPPADRPATRWRASPASAAARPISARWPATSWARCSPTT